MKRALFLLSIGLIGCGGKGGGGFVPPAPTPSPVLGSGSASQANTGGAPSIALVIPAQRKLNADGKRSAKYISASTKSVAIAVDSTNKSVTRIDDKTDGCERNSAGDLACTLPLPLTDKIDTTIDKHTISVELMGDPATGGAVLSKGETQSAIRAGDDIPITMYGVIDHVKVALDRPIENSCLGNQDEKYQVLVSAVDAEGNLIDDELYGNKVKLAVTDPAGNIKLSRTIIDGAGDDVQMTLKDTPGSGATQIVAVVDGVTDHADAHLAVRIPLSYSFDSNFEEHDVDYLLLGAYPYEFTYSISDSIAQQHVIDKKTSIPAVTVPSAAGAAPSYCHQQMSPGIEWPAVPSQGQNTGIFNAAAQLDQYTSRLSDQAKNEVRLFDYFYSGGALWDYTGQATSFTHFPTRVGTRLIYDNDYSNGYHRPLPGGSITAYYLDGTQQFGRPSTIDARTEDRNFSHEANLVNNPDKVDQESVSAVEPWCTIDGTYGTQFVHQRITRRVLYSQDINGNHMHDSVEEKYLIPGIGVVCAKGSGKSEKTGILDDLSLTWLNVPSGSLHRAYADGSTD